MSESELTKRINAQKLAIPTPVTGSLALRIQQKRSKQAFRSEGLDKLLDLTPVDQSELVIFCRKFSLLQTKIAFIRKGRSPAEKLEAMLAAATKGYCKTCFEKCKSCLCSPENQAWV